MAIGVGTALVALAGILLGSAAIVLVRTRVDQPRGPLDTRVTGAVLGLVVLAVVAAAYGFGALLDLGEATTLGVLA